MTDARARYWDKIAVEWRRAQPRTVWRDHCDEVNSSLAERWLPTGRLQRVLKTDLFDEAIGTGLFPLLSSHADEVAGIDIAATIVRAARKQHAGLRAIEADAQTLPFCDDAFDAVVSISTLDHFQAYGSIVKAISEIARILKPGGRLILTMDNPSNPLVRLRNALPIAWLVRLGLVPYYVGITAKHTALESAVVSQGLAVLDSTAILHCPRMPAVLLSSFIDAIRLRRPAARKRQFLNLLQRFESLEKWPTRYLTGYFLAILAEKRPGLPADGAK